MTTFYKPTPYNGDTKCQMWMSILSDSHDMHCGCDQPFAHMLSSIFPEGHSDRNKTINEIIERDYRKCHSGGEEEKDGGIPLGGSAATLQKEDIKEEENIPEGDVEELLAAVTDAEQR